jgi:hypothetical protein
MKKQLLLNLIFVLFCGIISGQHLIRVNNNPGADPDYATLQAANDAASNGDTIYVEGSTTEYDGADISKRLVIIGPGYFLTDNDSTQANGLESKFSMDIYFKAGSAGSIITGCSMSYRSFHIEVSNITIARCHGGGIYASNTISNILIIQNYLSEINLNSAVVTNSVIANNILTDMNSQSNSGPLQIVNNVFRSSVGIQVYNSSVANNILSDINSKIYVNTGNTINNNILAGAGTNANGNQYSVPMANVFVDFSGSLHYSDDAKWKLKTGSLAIGAGVSGVDCGVFGGATPYVLSGVPNLPHIYEATIAGTAYSDKGLACAIKVKSGR